MTIETRGTDHGKVFAASLEKVKGIMGELSGSEALAMTHSQVEALIHTRGIDLLRQFFQDHLDLRSVRETPQAELSVADGPRRTHRRRSARQLESLFGGVVVSRIAYGARGETSLHPLDATLNLPSGLFSHGVQRVVAVEAARCSFKEVLSTVRSMTGASVAKRQAEALAIMAAADFDAFYAGADYSVPGGRESILVLSADGKGIVMRHEDLREETRKAAESTPRKLAKRLAKGEKKNRKRMATVAAVYSIGKFVRRPEDIIADLRREKKEEHRPRPKEKRVWASVRKAPDAVIREAFVEGMRRDPDRRKSWVALVDGNAAQIEIFKRLAKEFDVALTIVCDVIHVIEYLWKAAYAFHDDGTPEAEDWVTERLYWILEGKAKHVAAGIRRSATNRRLSKSAREPIDACARYLHNHAEFLRYREYLAAGMPIATGVIEGACRHLIKDRLEITGARWSLDGAEAILKLRALRASGDFEAYWSHHEGQDRRRNHAQCLALLSPTPELEKRKVG